MSQDRTTVPADLTADSSRERTTDPGRKAKALPAADGSSTKVLSELLFSGVSDLGVLTWALIRLKFEDRPGEISYMDLTADLGVGEAGAKAVEKRFGATPQPLVERGWLDRRRNAGNNRLRYRALLPKRTGERCARLQRCDLALLDETAPGGRRKPAELVDSLRWQLECGTQGWAVETVEQIAKRWGVAPSTFRRRRDRIRATNTRPGLISVDVRPGLPDVVRIEKGRDPRESAAPQLNINAEPTLAPLPAARTPGPLRTTGNQSGGSPRLGPGTNRQTRVDRILSARLARRAHAVRKLLSDLDDLSTARSWWRPHEVYLIHFVDERRYKVGLTLADSLRVEYLTRGRSSVVVDRVRVANRFAAEMVEVDVLEAVQPWHQLGDRTHPGGGFTEMWSDDGPSIDLDSFVKAITQEVANLLLRPAELP